MNIFDNSGVNINFDNYVDTLRSTYYYKYVLYYCATSDIINTCTHSACVYY